ncbi:MAG: radical SAM protein [Dehalococcoidales bacterium]|nr:radical SAM protein [Dehalococcoidales bacterium]
MDYDVILIHPPAIYDFRRKSIFPGALGSTVERIQYTKVPIGMLSIADYIDRHGYKVIVDNLADRMVSNKSFNAEEHIKNASAKIFAIGLHWQHHSQGAIAVAKLCKQFHPDSLVILGGLTSTYFHEEIINKYHFIDAVIRGEAEKPLLEFIKAYQKTGQLTATPNLTYRDNSGEILITPLMETCDKLDEYEFTRFDLLEPKTSIFSTGPRWGLTICRGCIYNCTICGGSAYTYKKYLGRKKPAFRSPQKIVDDIRKLSKQGIRFVGLYQDPRMGGETYWRGLISSIKNSKLDIDGLTMDIFAPVSEEFAKEVASIGKPVKFFICPDSGSCDVRKLQGRGYSNEDLLNTAKLCYQNDIMITFFFSDGLSGETPETIIETRNIIDQLCLLQQEAMEKGIIHSKYADLVEVPIIGPIMLDPGSLAFDFPQDYGYKLSFNTLEEYVKTLSLPSWHQWLNHETNTTDRNELVERILESAEYSIAQKKKFGMYSELKAYLDMMLTKADRDMVKEINRIMKFPDDERIAMLKSLREQLTLFDSYLGSLLCAEQSSK